MDGSPITFDHRAHRELLGHLSTYLTDSQRILDAWNVYSDENTDLDGWPHDSHAYGLRASRRDAETHTAFEPLRDGARHLLGTAETQLTLLPEGQAQTRWVYQLGLLTTALDQLDALDQQWLETEDSLSSVTPGTPAYEDALAEHHAEEWNALGDWNTHGKAILEINAAARKAPSPLAPRPALAPTPRSRARA
ncbi:hypothetical protein K388_02699 [Streptomyces sp. KhCrAH-43]|uniref:hypothetical protein n=1 Tax=unclassified Streptomyces TaxID=2593676 RepID=UPI00037EB66C|nr:MULTISPECIES: hypothetical protein [unclassified Streptomyces]MYS36690.1 hypothetical protein [Streptomyces sp. SID4920]MYX69161.1 hypothetical protein [Streptomyces sp. SID8373]RAJ62013.1 hypothetical protein K388_02699 [Streptomyces sp. KhCrAH-43]